MSEKWRKIPGFYGRYEVSSLGKVKSTRGRWPTDQRLILTPDKNWAGYLRVTLFKKSKPLRYAVHRLVLTTFKGRAPKGEISAHLNGKRHDNRIKNLSWVSQKENCRHKFKHKTQPFGEKCYNSKLTKSDVREIFYLWKNKLVNPTELAEAYEVSPSNISTIVHGYSWNHVTKLKKKGIR